MKQKKFGIILLVLLCIAVGYYFYSTDRTSETVLIGIVDANQVIVSSKIMGRVEKLYVDEGSKVKAGDPIAEIDFAELEAQKTSSGPPVPRSRFRRSGRPPSPSILRPRKASRPDP